MINNMSPMEELYKKGFTDNEISDQLGIPVDVVVLWRRSTYSRHHKATRSYKSIIEEDANREMYKVLYDMGYNDESIAYLCGVAKTNAKSWRRSEGLPCVHQYTLATVKQHIKYYKIDIAESEDPEEDPESLFCSTKILEDVCSKDLE
jgi:hypothetical protein